MSEHPVAAPGSGSDPDPDRARPGSPDRTVRDAAPGNGSDPDPGRPRPGSPDRTVRDAAPVCATCATCGASPADDEAAALARLTWTRGTENGRQLWTCDACSRRHLPSIEGKLDSAWW